MSSDPAFVSEVDNATAQVDDRAAAQEDKAVEESEATGQISQQEVEGLKDSIGGGEVLDDSEGYTRSSNAESKAYQAEDDVDKAVDNLE